MNAPYRGTIIEESLSDTSVLNEVNTVSTKVETVTEAHGTPWLSQWTMHTVEIASEKAEGAAEKLSNSFDTHGTWYADFNNGEQFYVVYRGRVFRYFPDEPEGYHEAVEYGRSLGVPEHQLDFPSPK